MAVSVFHRMAVAAGIGTVAILGLSVVTSAQPPPQHEKQQQEDRGEAKQQKEKKPGRQKGQGRGQQERLPPQAQQDLIQHQQQRWAQYRDHLEQQQRLAPPVAVELQRQNRTAQYGNQQQYVAGMRQLQLRVQSQDRYDYGRDPYFSTAPTYRYSRGGQYYETNQYGVDLLRQAVNVGYEQGALAGQADRQDRWRSDYASAYGYQDANYGYSGFYVDRDDYNTYFREGFRRGYEDGYSSRPRYGRYVSGRGTVLGAVLATILNFQSIR